ncbi:hypothetical protein BGX26_001913 [Mortierella sp. AD094]|nr:hypothetical protein BGX26_001913 [Mortierella sp. AD094]
MARKLDRRLIPKVCEILSTDCKLVNNLTIETCNFSVADDDLAQIFESCQNLAQFKTPSSTLGILTVRALHRSYGSLTQLDLRTSYQVPSNMIHEILTSCPRMIKLKAGFLNAHHILGTTKEAKIEEQNEPQSNLYPIDWVCLDIQELSVAIQGLEDQPAEWHRQIFQQLGRLKKLEILDIGGCSGWNTPKMSGLELRLKTGLDKLVNLKKLKQLQFNRLSQEMDEHDVHWMLQSWPLLEVISGRLHFAYKFRTKLEKIIDDDERIMRSDCDFHMDETSPTTDSSESDEEGGVVGDAEPTSDETTGVIELTTTESWPEIFPLIQSLCFGRTFGPSPSQLQTIKKCPQLRRLASNISYDLQILDMYNAFKADGPFSLQLYITSVQLPHNYFAPIFNSCNSPACASQNHDSEQAFAALQRHCDTCRRVPAVMDQTPPMNTLKIRRYVALFLNKGATCERGLGLQVLELHLRL